MNGSHQWTIRQGQRAAALLLAVVLVLPASAQQVSPALLQAAREAYHQEQQGKSTHAFASPTSAQVTSAAATDPWVNLSRLRVDTDIRVETRDGRIHAGRFRAWSDEAITVRDGKREVTSKREDVLRITRPGERNRGRAAKIGFGIGFLAGTVTALSLAASDPADDKAAGVVASFGIGGLTGAIGAGIGALAAPQEWTLIYRAPPEVRGVK